MSSSQPPVEALSQFNSAVFKTANASSISLSKAQSLFLGRVGNPVSVAQSTTFTGNVIGITSTMVGLGNCDNTSDLLKPVSNETTTQLNSKASLAGSNAFTGSNSFSILPTSAVVPTNANQFVNKAYVDLFAPLASPSFTGIVSGISKAMVGLGNCDDTSDLNKPVSNATTTQLNSKASLAGNNAFTGTNTFNTSLPTSTQTPTTSTQLITK